MSATCIEFGRSLIDQLGDDAPPIGAKNGTFCAIYTLKRSFYQDRLGTNIGKVDKRVAFLLGLIASAVVRQAGRQTQRCFLLHNFLSDRWC